MKRLLRPIVSRLTPSALRQRAKLIRMRMARHRRLNLTIALLFTVAVTAAWLGNWFFIREVELTSYDKALKLLTREQKRSDKVVVLAVDDFTLQYVSNSRELRDQLGSWPFARVVWAEVIDYLARDGAKALVFDLVMDERGSAQHNVAMAEAMRASKLPVYVGVAIAPREREEDTLPRVVPYNRLPGEKLRSPRPSLWDEPKDDTGDVEPAEFMIGGDEDEEAGEPTEAELLARRTWEAEQLAFPVKSDLVTLNERAVVSFDGTRHLRVFSPIPPSGVLLDEFAGAGLVDPEEDPEDGVLRRTRFAYRDDHNTYVTLPLAVVADLNGARDVSIAPGELRVGDRRWRINPDGSAKIDYRGSLYDRYNVVKLMALFRDQTGKRLVQPGLFKDKVVVVGGVALATHDAHPTPFMPISPGVVKQAAIIDTLLGGEFIVDAPFWLAVLVTFLVALISASLVTTVSSSFLDIGWPLVLYTGFFVVTGVGLKLWNVHLPAAMPVWAGMGASITATAITRLFADRNRDRLKESFVRYLDRTLVEQMAEANELPRLEGENREITAFFSDIRGFSTFSEGMKADPQKLVRILNEYLTRVSAALMREGGCIDKYIGDAVVCLFGAPLTQQDHAVRACRGALAVQAEVAKLRDEFRAQGLPDVYTRVGLNSGVMFVGNFGSEQLFDYTAMGDDMNLASRLEGANKAYDTNIMLGEKTYALAKDHIEVRELDKVRVAGKKEPVVVYELLALKGQLDDHRRQVARLYEEALGLYRQARFAEALATLDRLDALDSKDGPSHGLRKRCEKYRAGAPEGFDGVANLEK